MGKKSHCSSLFSITLPRNVHNPFCSWLEPLVQRDQTRTNCLFSRFAPGGRDGRGLLEREGGALPTDQMEQMPLGEEQKQASGSSNLFQQGSWIQRKTSAHSPSHSVLITGGCCRRQSFATGTKISLRGRFSCSAHRLSQLWGHTDQKVKRLKKYFLKACFKNTLIIRLTKVI